MGYNTFGQDVPFPSAPGSATPGPMPGQLRLTDGSIIEVKDISDRPIFDTELILDPIVAGTDYFFFRNIAWPNGLRKDFRFTNMTIPNQLPSGWKARVYGVHLYVIPILDTAGVITLTTPEDVQRITYNAFCQFLTSSDKVEIEGTMEMFPSPYGLTGMGMFAGAALHEVSQINNGVPSPGALGPMKPTIDLVNEMIFGMRVVFPGACNLDNPCMLKCVLRTWTAKPVT